MKKKNRVTESPVERVIGTALAGLAIARVAFPGRHQNGNGNSAANGNGNGSSNGSSNGKGVLIREGDDHGRSAESPTDIPKRGWRDILFRTAKEIKDDNIPLLSAGVAFYAMLAIFPALLAVVSIYGLVAGPDEIAVQLRSFTRAMPAEAAQLITNQVASVASKPNGGLGLTAVIGILAALWSASSGMRWLLSALSLVHDQKETRKFLKLRGLALIMTLGAVVTMVVSLGALVATPSIFRALGLGTSGKVALNILRWPLLFALIIVGLAVLYRFGPDRDQPKWRWVSVGSVTAAVLWLAGSVGFTLYAAVAGKFNETYGALGGFIVLQLWLFLSAFAVLVGAEMNAETEHQTAVDSTVGKPKPMGSRDALMADEIGEPAPAH